MILKVILLFPGMVSKRSLNQKDFVRSGIRTHALIRGPECSLRWSEEYSSWVWRLRPLGHPDFLDVNDGKIINIYVLKLRWELWIISFISVTMAGKVPKNNVYEISKYFMAHSYSVSPFLRKRAIPSAILYSFNSWYCTIKERHFQSFKSTLCKV